VLVLSPHLDDAALSCPTYLQRTAQAYVATVFTEGDEALYRRRRSEDRKALRELGARPMHLGFLDAPYRSPKYRDFCGIVFGRAREYRGTARAVAQAIEQLDSKLHPRVILVPLAIGNHVDHRVVRDAALAAIPRDRLLFYEDRPYAFVPKSWKHYFAAKYVRRYRGSATDRRIIKAWESVPPFPLGLRRTSLLKAKPPELMRTLNALSAYSSQLADLFENAAEMRRLYHSAPEKLYRLTTAPS